MSVTDSRSFHVVADAKDPEGAKCVAALRARNPNVLFAVTRSCNLNIVAYEARVDQKHPTRIRSDDPLDVYWLNLESKYAAAARKQGQAHDRDELTWAERTFGYGAKVKPLTKGSGIYRVKMNALPSLPLFLGIDPRCNRPRVFVELHPAGDKPPGTAGGTPCVLDRIYVHVIWKLGGIPDVDWLTYYGTALSDNKPIHQRVNR